MDSSFPTSAFRFIQGNPILIRVCIMTIFVLVFILPSKTAAPFLKRINLALSIHNTLVTVTLLLSVMYTIIYTVVYYILK